jgi:hypothetical protein
MQLGARMALGHEREHVGAMAVDERRSDTLDRLKLGR